MTEEIYQYPEYDIVLTPDDEYDGYIALNIMRNIYDHRALDMYCYFMNHMADHEPVQLNYFHPISWEVILVHRESLSTENTSTHKFYFKKIERSE